MRRAWRLLVPGLALLGLAGTLSACESSQDKSAALKKASAKIGHEKGLSLTGTNPDVKVLDTAVLHDQYGTAAVVYLKNTSKASFGNTPVAIDVRNAANKSVFKNNVAGLDAALVSTSVLKSGGRTVWINNQIVGVGGKKVLVKIGKPKVPSLPAKLPQITLSKIKLDHDSDGPFVTGVITNHSKVLQTRLTIYCVARKGGKIVAAGRGVLDKLPGNPPAPKKPFRFSIYFIGKPKGAKLSFSVPPTVFK